MAKGYDQDGTMEKLKYFVDGEWLSAYTAYVQVIGKPKDGETFTVDDGNGSSLVFEFDADNSLSNPFNYKIEINQKFVDIEFLGEIVENYNSGYSMTPEEEVQALTALNNNGVQRFNLPAPNLLEEIYLDLKANVIDSQRNEINYSFITAALKEGLEISSEIIGMNGVYFRHKMPHIIKEDGNTLPKLVSQAHTNFISTNFTEGLVRVC